AGEPTTAKHLHRVLRSLHPPMVCRCRGTRPIEPTRPPVLGARCCRPGRPQVQEILRLLATHARPAGPATGADPHHADLPREHAVAGSDGTWPAVRFCRTAGAAPPSPGSAPAGARPADCG